MILKFTREQFLQFICDWVSKKYPEKKLLIFAPSYDYGQKLIIDVLSRLIAEDIKPVDRSRLSRLTVQDYELVFRPVIFTIKLEDFIDFKRIYVECTESQHPSVKGR